MDNHQQLLKDLPYPLNRQLTEVGFEVGKQEDAWKVIPAAWVYQAQQRWQPIEQEPLSAIGIDVARDSRDTTVIVKRHGSCIAEPDCITHSYTTPEDAAQLICKHYQPGSEINLNVLNVGSLVADLLADKMIDVDAINAASKSVATDKSGLYKYDNKRSELWFNLRELLDPDNDSAIALPADLDLAAELILPTFSAGRHGLRVESRADIMNRLNVTISRSEALVLACNRM